MSPIFVDLLRGPGIDSQPSEINSSKLNPRLHKRLQLLFLLGSTCTKESKTQCRHSGRVVDCNPEGRGIESRWCYFWWFIRRKVDGKLSENSFAGEQKTVGKFRWFRNIPSSSSELVGLTRSSRLNSFPSPLQVSLLHPVRLAEFSVNFFFSVYLQMKESVCRFYV